MFVLQEYALYFRRFIDSSTVQYSTVQFFFTLVVIRKRAVARRLASEANHDDDSGIRQKNTAAVVDDVDERKTEPSDVRLAVDFVPDGDDGVRVDVDDDQV